MDIILPEELSKQQLEDLLDKYDDQYHNSESIINDEDYDALLDIYERKYGKRNIVGYEAKSNRVSLPRYMGGVDKAQDEAKLMSFVNKWKAKGAQYIILEDKLDGISLYVKGDALYTRGRNGIGSDVSHLKKYLIKHDNKEIETRGEIVISKENFASLNGEYKNPRNLVSGAVSRKIPEEAILSLFDYVVYRKFPSKQEPDCEFLKVGDEYEIAASEQLIELNKSGLKTVWHREIPIDWITFQLLLDLKNERDERSPYEIDGLILIVDLPLSYPKNKNPDHILAFKPHTKTMIAEVLSIEWQSSKHGVLNPVVLYEPINLDGAKLEKATGHNAKYICDNKIGIGAKVKIRRSGGVIPYIVEVVEPSDDIPFPEEYKWDENEVRIVSLEENEETKIKKIDYFFRQFDTKHLGIETITKLYRKGFDTIEKLLVISVNEIIKAKIPSIAEKSAKRIVEQISKCFDGIDIWKFMAASSIFPNVAEKRLKLIFDTYPNILEYYKDKGVKKTIDCICEIKGIKKKIASVFVTNLDRWIEFRESIPNIKVKQDGLQIIFEEDEKSEYEGKNIVFSGFRDKSLENKLTSLGAFIKSAVSSKTHILIVKEIGLNKGKETKANELGIRIVTKEEIESTL